MPSAHQSSPPACGQMPRPPARSIAPRPHGDAVIAIGTSAVVTRKARADADSGRRQKVSAPAASSSTVNATAGRLSASAAVSG